ncbi:hypothetical protein BV20DRAFT_18777 [Pilatotrama ljubarskyi]|nr:hypothetical protein BV20DRAFT_18777 [Pilatotrama ljubarskyi]
MVRRAGSLRIITLHYLSRRVHANVAEVRRPRNPTRPAAYCITYMKSHQANLQACTARRTSAAQATREIIIPSPTLRPSVPATRQPWSVMHTGGPTAMQRPARLLRRNAPHGARRRRCIRVFGRRAAGVGDHSTRACHRRPFVHRIMRATLSARYIPSLARLLRASGLGSRSKSVAPPAPATPSQGAQGEIRHMYPDAGGIGQLFARPVAAVNMYLEVDDERTARRRRTVSGPGPRARVDQSAVSVGARGR